ncbi:hypothetical protein B0A49_02536 [Cryomyces minteri]|uniref:Uncharacterized protein n=1 Tax=Cryomyces minteri TaxID=331657 RepID=A0A4V5NKH5_9PEZI|nr:hypothetical protein B0A49_02536 [Cryomyces minteri]
MAPKKPKELGLDELRAAVGKIEERIDAEALKLVKLITEAGPNGENEEFEEPLALASKHLSHTSGVRSKEMLARRVIEGENVQSVASKLKEGAEPKTADSGTTAVAAPEVLQPGTTLQVRDGADTEERGNEQATHSGDGRSAQEAGDKASMLDAGATVVAAVDRSEPNRKRQAATIDESARKKAKRDENASKSTAVAADEDRGRIGEQTGVDGKMEAVIDLTGE